ncbi:hypothetical protein THAOC_32002 [Thalassiosira oceanica]|uniref:Uncharacterized protein n=1 Tax=Thalassiosira oceanica TaxID=159749 RepID=K0RR64_THAOC|nr:hypothetical protein THAOC_32002 [Thalassiosira oceanica]|eukprot:EJK49152.1 hypothetical protein THAOC_32002 [Thalassiosira oceanica]
MSDRLTGAKCVRATAQNTKMLALEISKAGCDQIKVRVTSAQSLARSKLSLSFYASTSANGQSCSLALARRLGALHWRRSSIVLPLAAHLCIPLTLLKSNMIERSDALRLGFSL